MAKPLFNSFCCCASLKNGIMGFTVLYSILFGGGIMGLLTANSKYKYHAWETLWKNWNYASFLVVTIPRFIAFWVAYCSNTSEERISTSVRWSLVVTYCVTMLLSVFFTGLLGYYLASHYKFDSSFYVYGGITVFHFLVELYFFMFIISWA